MNVLNHCEGHNEQLQQAIVSEKIPASKKHRHTIVVKYNSSVSKASPKQFSIDPGKSSQ